MDPEGKGYIREDVIHNLLTTQGYKINNITKIGRIKFAENVFDQFHDYAIDKTGQYFYYEDYVAKLIEENEKHMQYLLKDYETFKIPMGK